MDSSGGGMGIHLIPTATKHCDEGASGEGDRVDDDSFYSSSSSTSPIPQLSFLSSTFAFNLVVGGDSLHSSGSGGAAAGAGLLLDVAGSLDGMSAFIHYGAHSLDDLSTP